MASAKETIAEIIARQPEDSSYDEILFAAVGRLTPANANRSPLVLQATAFRDRRARCR